MEAPRTAPNFSTLPTEIQQHIFSYSSCKDLVNQISLVCQKWRQLTTQDNTFMHERVTHDINIYSVGNTSMMIKYDPDTMGEFTWKERLENVKRVEKIINDYLQSTNNFLKTMKIPMKISF